MRVMNMKTIVTVFSCTDVALSFTELAPPTLRRGAAFALDSILALALLTSVHLAIVMTANHKTVRVSATQARLGKTATPPVGRGSDPACSNRER
jgi:hypothetical protein